MNAESKKCFLCKNTNLQKKYYYQDKNTNREIENYQYFNSKNEIYTCEICKISFCDDISIDNLNKFYESASSKKSKILTNKFKEFNSRFFSQVLYYINHCPLKPNLKVLEIGPNNQGILPSLKIFQNKIIYYYFDQVELEHKFDNIIKLGNFWIPKKNALPKVDLIWMSHSLEHVHPKQLNDVLESFYSCLNEKGRIFIEIPYDIKNNDFIVPHTLFFEAEGLINLFKKFNFKIVSISEINKEEVKDNDNKMIIKNENKSKLSMTIISKIYQKIQKFLPEKLVKKFAFKNFVLNGPYTSLPIIRMIVEK
jgi:hypothetical protein